MIINQQHFYPAAKGVIYNIPATVIPDGSYQEVYNVRFGDGVIEKRKGLKVYDNQLDKRVNAINLFAYSTGNKQTIIHTDNNAYLLNKANSTLESILDDPDYDSSGKRFVSADTFNDEYYFTNLANDIYVWDGISDKAQKLIGTYKPTDWRASTEYVVGDIIKPPDAAYTGFVYKCVMAGTSGEEMPNFPKTNDVFQDGTVRWQRAGGLEIEGNSASSLRARILLYWKGFIFLVYTEEDGTVYPQRIRWSQYQNPNMWHNNEDGSGLAGYVDVADSSDSVVTAKVFGEHLIIYKQNSIQVMSFIGGDTTFERAVAVTDVGLISPRAIITTPNEHIFVGSDNIYSFDGVNTTPIGNAVKSKLFTLIEPSRADETFAFFDEDYPEIWFAFFSVNASPTATQPDMAITYNPSTKAWSFRDFDMSAVGYHVLNESLTIDEIDAIIDSYDIEFDSNINSSEKQLLLGGCSNGCLYTMVTGADDRGDYEGYVITKTHHMNAPEVVKRLMRIQFHLEEMGDFPLMVQVGYGNNTEGVYKWTEPLKLNLQNPNPPWVDCDLTARYFKIRFGTTQNSQPFRIIGYTLYYQVRTMQ